MHATFLRLNVDMSLKVGIVDYGVGNITSVFNAFDYLNVSVKVINDKDNFNEFSHLVLPGVGSFSKGMENLTVTDMNVAILNFAETGKPILGICLGMQLLGKEGDEFDKTNGLGLIDGKVSRITTKDSNLRLPHVGWNDIKLNSESKILAGMKDGDSFYFVHSYAYDNPLEEYVTATCEYGKEIVAVVEKENVFGAQFHPEKSQKNGLSLLRNFTKVC